MWWHHPLVSSSKPMAIKKWPILSLYRGQQYCFLWRHHVTVFFIFQITGNDNMKLISSPQKVCSSKIQDGHHFSRKYFFCHNFDFKRFFYLRCVLWSDTPFVCLFLFFVWKSAFQIARPWFNSWLPNKWKSTHVNF